MKNLKSLSFVIVTHVYATGPSFKLEEYLKDKVDTLVFIGHPFSFAEDTRSFLRIYKRGALIEEKKFKSWKGTEISFYIKDLCLTMWWYLKYRRKTDYFIGVNNFNVFAGLVLGLFLNVGRVIFYTIDYVPNRFTNPFLNSLYHFLDRLAVSRSHKVWNLSKIMVSEREKSGISREFRDKQIEVPIGTDIRGKPLSFDKIDKGKIDNWRRNVGK
ncbi:MAG: Glycosyl transferase group 1 [Microgenomates group bacterium GW2011_GWA2_37_6]|nr:MAG: Glycosyl transferase group 1 [Microgenomates group bacterium GW2011_GWA2_37_6]